MKNGLIRRSLAAASATAMAGAALVVGGAGVASAAPVSATAETSGGLGSHMKATRTASEGVVTYGDTVTVSTKLERLGSMNGNLVYWMRDHTPQCLRLVDRATNGDAVTWTPSNGTTYTNGSKPGEVSVTDSVVEVNAPALNSHNPPITMTARYVVTCDAGSVPTGGFQFDGTVRDGNFPNMGPTITVQRKGTSILFHQPTNPEVGQEITLNVQTTDVPEGAQIAFTADGQAIGSGTVTSGRASIPWTPASAGNKVIRGTYAQTATHGGSVAERSVAVSQANQNSTVAVNVPGTPQVGQSTGITATVAPVGAGGIVEFRANNVLIGEALVQADGTAGISWIPSLPVLTTIDARFAGRAGVNPSTGVAPAFTVAEADPGAETTITTLAPVAASPVGQEITLSAAVAPSNATGSVDFFDGQTLIGRAAVIDGVATFAWTPAADGARTIRAEFVPTGNFLASQGTTQTVITPRVVDPQPDPDPIDPADPGTGSLGSLTGSLGS